MTLIGERHVPIPTINRRSRRATATRWVNHENSYAWFMTLRDGKVVDGTAFYDSIAFDDPWARVTPDS